MSCVSILVQDFHGHRMFVRVYLAIVLDVSELDHLIKCLVEGCMMTILLLTVHVMFEICMTVGN